MKMSVGFEFTRRTFSPAASATEPSSGDKAAAPRNDRRVTFPLSPLTCPLWLFTCHL